MSQCTLHTGFFFFFRFSIHNLHFSRTAATRDRFYFFFFFICHSYAIHVMHACRFSTIVSRFFFFCSNFSLSLHFCQLHNVCTVYAVRFTFLFIANQLSCSVVCVCVMWPHGNESKCTNIYERYIAK